MATSIPPQPATGQRAAATAGQIGHLPVATLVATLRMMLRVEWDEAKRLRNLREHGVDFIDAALIFAAPEIVEAADERRNDGETRLRALGRVDDDWFVVVYTWRGDVRRIISAWKVGDDGKRRYQNLLAR
jgi:uncharacterized protein